MKTDLFPYEKFPIRLEYKDGNETRICWFECEEHLQKYLERYRLNEKTSEINYKNAKPIRSSKTNKRSVESKSSTKSKRSTSPVRRRKSSVDSTGNTTRNSKSKK